MFVAARSKLNIIVIVIAIRTAVAQVSAITKLLLVVLVLLILGMKVALLPLLLVVEVLLFCLFHLLWLISMSSLILWQRLAVVLILRVILL